MLYRAETCTNIKKENVFTSTRTVFFDCKWIPDILLSLALLVQKQLHFRCIKIDEANPTLSV